MGVYRGVTQDNITVQGGTLYDITVQGGSSSGFIVPFLDISGRKYGQFYSTQTQTPVTNTPTALTFNNSESFNTGVSVVSNSRITYTTTGIYNITVSVQFNNTKNTNDHEAYLWFRKNGTDIANSNTVVTVPKANDGGKGFLEISIIESITANQYIEAITMVEDSDVDIEYIAASAGPPVVPAVPSVIYTTHRIG